MELITYIFTYIKTPSLLLLVKLWLTLSYKLSKSFIPLPLALWWIYFAGLFYTVPHDSVCVLWWWGGGCGGGEWRWRWGGGSGQMSDIHSTVLFRWQMSTPLFWRQMSCGINILLYEGLERFLWLIFFITFSERNNVHLKQMCLCQICLMVHSRYLGLTFSQTEKLPLRPIVIGRFLKRPYSTSCINKCFCRCINIHKRYITYDCLSV